MTHRFPRLTALLLAAPLLASAPAFAETPTPGLTQRSLPVAHDPGALDAAIWYPAGPGGVPTEFAKNPVFNGVAAREDAPPLPGKHPLVLLSHGLGGNNRTLGWLAAGLAEAGAIVVAVNHPGSTTRDFDIDRGLNHWTRVTDLGAALDGVMADPKLGPLVDQSQITALGFSYGGWTALSMAGLRGNLAAYASHCATVGETSTHCRDLARAGVDLTSRDAGLWNADHRDARISKAVAIDPALTWGLTDELASLDTPTLLIGLGAGHDRLFATDTTDAGSGFASRLARMSPDTRVVEIAPAGHFSALLTCTDIGAAILQDEGDDPVCTDPAGTDRAKVHAQIIAEVSDFLGL